MRGIIFFMNPLYSIEQEVYIYSQGKLLKVTINEIVTIEKKRSKEIVYRFEDTGHLPFMHVRGIPQDEVFLSPKEFIEKTCGKHYSSYAEETNRRSIKKVSHLLPQQPFKFKIKGSDLKLSPKRKK